MDSNALALALRSGMREVVAARDLAGITTAVQRARSVANAIGQTLLDEAQAAAQTARAEVAAEVAKAAADAQAEADAPRGKVVTVFSTKGGVGKSLGRDQPRRRAGRERSRTVCLVDLDVNSGDVAIMLQLTPQRTINDLVGFNGVDRRRRHRVDPDAPLRQTCPSSPPRCGSTAPTRPPASDIGKLLDALRAHVDFVVVDTSGVFDDHALRRSTGPTSSCWSARSDIPSLKALKLATEHPRPAQLPEDRRGGSSSTAPTARSA